jgi:hypothetical protein
MLSLLYEMVSNMWWSSKKTYNKTTYFTKITVLMLILTVIAGTFAAFGVIFFRSITNFFGITFAPIKGPTEMY